MKIRANVVGPIGLALFGGIFLVVGLLIARSGRADARELADHPLHVIALADLSDTSVGAHVDVEAVISSSNPRGFGEYVAYDRLEFDGHEANPPGAGERGVNGPRARPANERERWKTIDRRRPPLELEGDRASGRVVNDDYELEGALHHTDDGRRRRAGFGVPGSIKTTGVRVGDVVVVRGTVVGGHGASELRRALRARTIFVGDRVALAASLAESIEVSRILGVVFACVGGVIVAVAVAWYAIARRIFHRRRAIR